LRLSKRFKLGVTQFELDFVDIDPNRDHRLFLDAYFLANRPDQWSVQASKTIRSFFNQFVALIRKKKDVEARALFEHLHEPNETCLGLSKGNPQGRGVGNEFADRLFASLKDSKAVQTGLVEDLEDARIFVPGINKDLASDMATNIIRAHLLKYTKSQCDLWNIPLTANVPSGFVWDRPSLSWQNTFADRLVVGGKPLLLVPKGIVSYVKAYAPDKYHRFYVLPFLQHEHLRMNTALVRVRRKGKVKYVTKKSVIDYEAPPDKEYLASFTEKHPEVFKDFRAKTVSQLASLSNTDLSKESLNEVIDYLIDKIGKIAVGNASASVFHRTMVGVLELLFYPDLIAPQIEREIHDGRKRIDITFDNAAQNGFFFLLHQKHGIPCPYIFVECKNYGAEVANPELDQLAGRFSPNSGKFGLLVCRKMDDLGLFIKRCADTYKDDRGAIVPLMDSDIIQALVDLRKGVARPLDSVLTDRMRDVVLA